MIFLTKHVRVRTCLTRKFDNFTKRKPAEAGSEFLLRGMSYPRLRLGCQCEL